ncbi:beta-2-microglobulin-like [Pempheris klunzingeri]|uniref:beta-2-microglobulin-like n=1 Tax=Pempheris klunzingeri TaxID=3127111 RepID=UPI00397EAD38
MESGSIMRPLLILAALTAVFCAEDVKRTSPEVKVYSRYPGQYGRDNILICHVSGFHPPDIKIQLMKDGVELSGAQQTDLAFSQNWRFHLTKDVSFSPSKGEKYSCKVTHGMTAKDYIWEPNM